ncbi:hypothetical protein GCM10009827_063920 [Dactylosporangium maewongense]|uniref:Knr4/Smi1-like domain-containing protein n=1 Tax=Dactylosporangium maewongense TaxID=634393 RepID=A0ABN2B9H8_9ACTN
MPVSDTDHVRLERIAAKLAAARALPTLPDAFGVDGHRFDLGAPVAEAAVVDWEERHEVALPAAYRLFVTELGDGGAGPGGGMLRLLDSCDDEGCQPGHLALPSPYLPGPRYFGDWEQRYEDPPGPDRVFLRGTLRIAWHGCSLCTQLVVTGPARGRLFNLDIEGPVGPYVAEDADFLAWYERWLDEAVAGYDVDWFGERLPLDEPALVAVLAGDASPQRRARAGESLLQLAAVSDRGWTAVAEAVSSDEDAGVRAQLLFLLQWPPRDRYRRLDNAEAAADAIARYARSRPRPDLRALAELRRLTFADVAPELSSPDVEQRRCAAYHLAWEVMATGVPQHVLEDEAGRLLDDPDPLLRSHGVAVVRRYDLAGLHSRLRRMQRVETDRWVQRWLS